MEGNWTPRQNEPKCETCRRTSQATTNCYSDAKSEQTCKVENNTRASWSRAKTCWIRRQVYTKAQTSKWQYKMKNPRLWFRRHVDSKTYFIEELLDLHWLNCYRFCNAEPTADWHWRWQINHFIEEIENMLDRFCLVIYECKRVWIV